MAANETRNYEQLFNQIKTEIDKATVAIRETKGNTFKKFDLSQLCAWVAISKLLFKASLL